MAAPRHTIVLIQQTESPSSRTYYDFDNRQQMVEGLLKIYEETIKSLYSHKTTITYDVADVYAFIDGMGDISCLIQSPASGTYEPHDREYIKLSIYRHLASAAQ